MTSGTRRRLTWLSIAALVAATGCWGGDDDAEQTTTTTAVPTPSAPSVVVEGVSVDTARPLGLRLSEGSAAGVAAETIEVVDGEALTVAEVDAILARLPEWVLPEPVDDSFVRPPLTLLPPTAAATIDGVFPPDTNEPVSETAFGPVEVLRYQPEGDVDVAPFLSITFDQPMVPLATLEQLDAADVPVRVTPELADGRWRWVGTRTLRFDPDGGALDRLPGATEYHVEIPAGTRSALGNRLSSAVSWTFTTPAVSITDFVGDDDTTPLDPVFVATFDQLVDPTAVLATISLTVDGDDRPLRLASAAEIDADEDARRAMAAALDGRAVAFRATSALPTDTSFMVLVGPGTPSAEGPLTTDEPEMFTGRTFGSLRIEDADCGWGDECTPGDPFVIQFSNRLDPDAFSADQISIEPPIADAEIQVYGSTVQVLGATEGRSEYALTFGAELTDVFGQTLGTDRTLRFEVGSAPPALRGLTQEWLTLDPMAERPTITVTSINHEDVRVRAWAVTPARLTEYRDYLDRSWSDEEVEPPEEWPEVYDEVVEIDAQPDRWVDTEIDLSRAFNQAGSQLVVRIEPTVELSRNDDDYWRNRPTVSWVQRTTLGIDAFVDGEHMVIWTTDLRTGEPVGKVPVELIGDGRVATTDAEGLAEIELGEVPVVGLWGNGGDRTAFLVSDWWNGWERDERHDEVRWYVVDDRGIYRPGETVRLTGWVRNLEWSADGQLALWQGATGVNYTVSDAQGVELATGTARLNRLGGFNTSIELPNGANLGSARVELDLSGAAGRTRGDHRFEIQEFRRPEFEVGARAETAGPYFVAEPATVAVDATYFSGGPLPDADVDWLVTTRTTSYTPPNWGDYVFGEWTPWWWSGSGQYDDWCYDCWGDAPDYQSYSGRTDAGGTHYLQIDFDGPDVDLPTTVTAEATVFDVNRQAWAASTGLLVHAARYYVGVRSETGFVERGEPIVIDAVVTDVDGNVVADRPIEVTAGRIRWVRSGGSWVEEIVDPQTCDITSTSRPEDGSMRCEFSTDTGGTYRVTAIVSDGTGHSNRTETTQWVSGGAGRPTLELTQGEVTIVPDHDSYAPGDVAEILVQAPFTGAHGIFTVVRGSVISTESFEAEDGSAVLEIPIEDAWIPNVTVQVDMVGGDLGPAFATGSITLPIPPISRELSVVATPADTELEPGDDTTVTITVTDATGEPVPGADVALVVVDEAVLSLTGYELTDPLDVFYAGVWSRLQSQYLRSTIVLSSETGGLGSEDRFAVDDAIEEPAAEAEFSDDGDAGADLAATSTGAPIDLRTNFDALAVYAPSESTAPDGTVTVDVPLPDSLTRYRVMAIAVDGVDRFGKGESTITARLPLQVRPSAPRFLNYGDSIELPVVVQNQSGEPIEVEVAIETSNLTLTGPAGKRITVPANDRVEVRFPATADTAGTARFRAAVVSGDHADAATGSFPVYTPATTEAFATYGVVDDGAIAQPISAPTDVVTEYGGLEISTSSTAVQALTDAVLYLVDFRYESSDGLASRIMAVAALRDVLDAFDADGLPDAEQLDVRVSTDIERLQAMQNDNGGWPWFQRGRESIPFRSIQATHALVLADGAGYSVDANVLERALAHLAQIEEYFPSTYSAATRDTLSSYALAVRAQAGDRDVSKATTLYNDRGDELGLDAIAWLWPSITNPDLRDEIATIVANATVETAGSAVFATAYAEDAYVISQSERRTDGIVLGALISEQPDSDVIPKVVTGLLGHQTRGRWGNVYENAFILLALHDYFAEYEDVTPDFVARAWLGDLYAAESEFRGRTTEQVTTLVPMNLVVDGGDSTVVVEKDGEGRLYYRLGLRYAPSDLQLAARDEGFVVERVYEGVDDPTDVTRDSDGTWRIRAGATVRVTVTMIADAQRTGVALVDPLPAGLEAVNPELAGSTTVPDDPSGDDWWWGWTWFGHQNLRDDRAEAFADWVPGGAYEYSYIARATTPGTFVVPPAKAEEMYAPEVFGRSASDRVVVG